MLGGLQSRETQPEVKIRDNRAEASATEEAVSRLGTLEDFSRDIRYGARALIKKPGFTIIAILTLALGIGANTAIFSVVNAALLTPIAIPEPDRVVMVWSDQVTRGSQGFPASGPDFLRWQASGVFSELAGFVTAGCNLLIGTRAERAQRATVTGEWFTILRAKPYLGRLFRPQDMARGHDEVAVLTYDLWHSRFHADPAVLGSSTVIDSVPYAIIGVLPKKVAKIENEDLYTPLVLAPPLSTELALRTLGALGRLTPGLSLAAAQSRMRDISEQLAREYPHDDGTYRARLQPVEEAYVEDVHNLLWVLFAAVGFVLLIACANIANLLMVRAAARSKEMAIRAALGASKWRLIRQLLTESVLLSIAAALVGIIPAYLALRFFSKMQSEQLPNAELVTINFRVLTFTLLLAVATGVLFGLIPAWQAWKTNANAPLRERSQTSGGRRYLFVMAEVALTVILVTGAGLMLRSFIHLRSRNPGYESQRVLTMRIELSGKQYDSPEKQVLFAKRLIDAVGALPGVDMAGVVSSLPTSTDVQGGRCFTPDRASEKDSAFPLVTIHASSPNYLPAMRIPLVRGRFFSEADGSKDMPVAILDADSAKELWPNQDPIGKIVRLRRTGPLRKIVGVVRPVDLSIAVKMKGRVGQVYIPLPQVSEVILDWGTSLAVLTPMDPTALVSPVRSVIANLAPDQSVFDVQTMEEARAKGQASARLGTWLLGCFAGLALLLAAVGVYGVISYTVGQRTREMGVRIAVGASQYDILRIVLANGMWMIVVGVLLGLAGALAVTHLMGSLLYGISATDPTTFVSVAVLLLAVGLLASYVPARRASRVDPTIALRYE